MGVHGGDGGASAGDDLDVGNEDGFLVATVLHELERGCGYAVGECHVLDGCNSFFFSFVLWEGGGVREETWLCTYGNDFVIEKAFDLSEIVKAGFVDLVTRSGR